MSAPRENSVSIILPVFNEAKVIERVIRDIDRKIVKTYKGECTLIVAEDGSTDGTKEILENLKESVGFHLVSGKERKGYNRAVKDALALGRGAYVFLTDSGGGHEPDDFFKMMGHMGEQDIVSGYKEHRQDPGHRLVLSFVFNALVSLLFLHRFTDIDSGFKIYRKEVLDDVLPEVRTLDQVISSEILLRAHQKGYRIKEVPVTHYKRDLGEIKTFKIGKLPGIVYDIFSGIVRLRLQI